MDFDKLNFVTDMARIEKDNFRTTYDYGYPVLPERIHSGANDEVLILYASETARPASFDKSSGSVPRYSSAEEATANCEVMSVVVTNAGDNPNRCLVVMDHYENHHIEKWQRIGKDGSPPPPLKVVPKGMNPVHGRITDDTDIKPPGKVANSVMFSDLKTYFTYMQPNLAKLGAVLKPIAVQNTVIVMVCNKGQANMLLNFVCSAKSRGLSLEHVVIFATDAEAAAIAKSLGLATFLDEHNFARLPTTSADYGGYTFTDMMWAKVVSAHLVSNLGYNMLFQDLDIVWHRNPLEYFHNLRSSTENPDDGEWDMYFQDDGARSARFAPFAANSGFYYSRHNDRTRELFNARLFTGNQIQRARSDQSVFDALLEEQASRFGLRVKTLSEDDFPGGRYAQEASKEEYMKQLFRGEVTPWIFHMNWTLNTKEKLKKMSQAGMWYVKDDCTELDSSGGAEAASCCLAEPLIKCEIKGKPCASDFAKVAPK
jgi:hypothetical protein